MSDGAALGVLLAFMGTFALIIIAWYVLQIIAYWRIFTKAGEAGWKSIIPFYNAYTQYKLTWNTTMFWVAFAAIIVGTFLNGQSGIISIVGYILTLVAGVVNIVASYKLSLAFGHGVGFTIGLILLNPIFMLILGFGHDEYQGPQ